MARSDTVWKRKGTGKLRGADRGRKREWNSYYLVRLLWCVTQRLCRRSDRKGLMCFSVTIEMGAVMVYLGNDLLQYQWHFWWQCLLFFYWNHNSFGSSWPWQSQGQISVHFSFLWRFFFFFFLSKLTHTNEKEASSVWPLDKSFRFVILSP